MSNIFILFFIILLISKKIILQEKKECSEISDCFNCTLIRECDWENDTCIINSDCASNDKNCKETLTLLGSDDNPLIYRNLNYLRNICFKSKAPYLPEENYRYDKISDKYCGPNFLFADDEFLKNGYKIELTNNSNIYGVPNLVCEYIITHGQGIINADIFINRSLSEDFLLFFSYEYDANFRITYSMTYSITGITMNSASFLFYSNKSFETSPFIIYFKSVEPDESEVLTYLFLAATIGFVALAIVGIILVRKCSIFFNLKKNNKKNNGIVDENKGELSIINEKNIENSKNEMGFDFQEMKAIKEKTSIVIKDNKDEKKNK